MIRPAGAQDLPFLRDMLRHAYYARWGTDADVPLERYVAGWGRPGDSAIVSIDEFQPVGASWYRLFETYEPGYGFVDEETPELTLVVVPTKQGQGIGGQLLDAVLERAKLEGFDALSVSVHRGDSETESYLAQGFEQVHEHGNTLTLRRPL